MTTEPKTIGRYAVLGTLGSGGMGVVYLAEDPRLKRRVAVKLVRAAGMELDQALARFQREAEISARLSHPNIITIHDVGEEPGLGPFLTMEYVEGASLAEHVRSQSLDVETRIRVLIQASRAIETAHAAGIVHRDIKPANLMLGKDGRVRLMDFGIARTDQAMMTQTGAVLGTPSYISPEQLKGAEPSAATDRYAFFVMAFELLTGRQPYAGGPTSAILYRIAHEPPEIPESLGRALCAVFEKALAKSSDGRHPDLAAFLRDLIRASTLDRAARARLEALLDEGRPSADADEPALPSPAAGRASDRFPLFVVGGVILVAIGAGAFLWVRPEPAAVEAARVEPARVETPKVRTTSVEPAVPPSALEAATPTASAARAAEPDPTPAPRVVASLVPQPPPRRPTADEIAPRVLLALRARGLDHVTVSVEGADRLRLAELASQAEADRARKIAVETGAEDLTVLTSLRKPSPATAPPRVVRPTRPTPRPPASEASSSGGWGAIQHEGAVPTE